MSTFDLPVSELPRKIQWETSTDEHGVPVKLAWWEAATALHGGRPNTPVVRTDHGYMYVFNSRGSHVGTIEDHETWRGGLGAEFWPLSRSPERRIAPWLDANLIRPTETVLVQADGVLGVVDRAMGDQEGRAWRVAHACLLLGFYPPMGLRLPSIAQTFIQGVGAVGDRAARRIKRALLSRLALERRVIRERAACIERRWR